MSSNEDMEAVIAENEGTSSLSEFSTYAPAADPKVPQNPPSGPSVEQTRGAPTEIAATKKTAAAKAPS